MATGFNTQAGNGEYRLQFETDNKEYYLLMQETARHCVDGKPVTNADRIRAMSDEELANIMADTPICKERYMDCIKDGNDCEICLLEWLKQTAEG